MTRDMIEMILFSAFIVLKWNGLRNKLKEFDMDIVYVVFIVDIMTPAQSRSQRYKKIYMSKFRFIGYI